MCFRDASVAQYPFWCVQEVYLLTNKWYYWRYKTAQEKLNLLVSVPSSILDDVSKLNESRYQAQHLSIYQVSGKLNVKLCFWPMMN